MNAASPKAHPPAVKLPCQGSCSGYSTCSNCPPLIVVAMMGDMCMTSKVDERWDVGCRMRSR
jgi:hypothetical protein